MDPIRFLLKDILGHINDESIGVLYDSTYSEIIDDILAFCEKNEIEIIIKEIDTNTSEPIDKEVENILIKETPEIIIIALRNSIWHTKERKKAKYEKLKRLANILHPGKPCNSYISDIGIIEKIGNQLKDLLENNEYIRIFSESGTDLSAKIGHVFCENGNYKQPGSGGDFPSGEVGFGPIEYSVNGTIVFDYKIQHVGFVTDDHHNIKVENDKIVNIDGSQKFIDLLDSNNIFKYISEISIGINPIWAEVENHLSIVEEKNLGTMHFGFGGNLSYGNRKGPHFDAVILKPTIYLDDMLIMENGNLINGCNT